MIKSIKVGDITDPMNHADIIIGMNTTLEEVTGIGLPFIQRISVAHPIVRGSVLSFEITQGRNIHMIICHDIGRGGWTDAERQVRFGMDYLWHTESAEFAGGNGFDRVLVGEPPREYSIVQIGTGRVGKRDGADPAAIHRAMAESFLPVELYVYEAKAHEEVMHAFKRPLRAYRAWHPVHGEERIAA